MSEFGAFLVGKLIALPFLALGYFVFLILTSERRKKATSKREPGADDE